MSTDKSLFVDQTIFIDNYSGNLSKLILEPWTDEVDIKKGDTVTVVGNGPVLKAGLEVEYKGNRLVIYGWNGSSLTVYVNGKNVPTFSMRGMVMLPPTDP
jgi:ribosomal protein L21E